MELLLSDPVLTTCENEENYNSLQKIETVTEYDKKGLQLFSFTIKARQWKRLTELDHFAEVAIPSIQESILKSGAVFVYLSEAGRHVALPFTYYQVRRALSFQPSYEKGYIYINILGNFILNIHDTYTFRVLVVNAPRLKGFRKINWNNYEEVKRRALK
jgi:hypothetical protein